MTSPPAQISYLGPPRTFTHEATITLFGDGPNLLPLSDVPAVLKSVERGQASFGVVPIENSVYGEVTATMDALVFDFADLYVSREAVIPVSFCAFKRTGDNSSPSAIISHPHALAQCRRFAASLGVNVRTADSTAAACQEVSNSTMPGLVAIGSISAGTLYGLTLMASRIEDYPGAATKFYALSKRYSFPSNESKTLVVLIPQNHNAGVLLGLLAPFSRRGLSVISIHSRPLRSSLGSYCFILTVEGHIGEPSLHDALAEVLSAGTELKFLGSFPAWKGVLPTAPFESIRGSASGLDHLKSYLNSMDSGENK